jgi:pimeloyl-ACP methyl ester carboxylesterase
MSLFLWTLGGVGAVTGSSAAALYGLTIKAQRPRLVRNETEPSVPFETVEWKSNGDTVRGWFLKQCAENKSSSLYSQSPVPIIIIAHGWGSNRSRVLRYALPLYEEGYSVLMYDARSHGDSDYYKTPTGLQFRDDLLAAIEWLRERPEGDLPRIGVLGHSLGGFGAVLALDAKAPIAALVTDSMPVKFSTMIGAELKRRKLPKFPLAQLLPRMMIWRSRIPQSMMKRANPVAILENNAHDLQVPVLLVHSLKDGFIPSTELNLVLARTPDLPHLFVNSDGHSASEQDPEFWPTVKAFFRSKLG